jgi:CO/xanthine dehydrogenase FAD-binding subunit
VRAYLPAYELHVPKTLKEALGLLRGSPGKWQPIAGGTDLMVLFEAGKLPQGNYLSLWGMSELRGFEETPTSVTLGALTTYTEIRENPVLQNAFPLLCQAASQTGAIAIQNRGTLGGNIANASPAADSPPALLVYGAEIELVSERGDRWVPYGNFHLGYKKMEKAPDELIRRVRIARPPDGTRSWYRKVGTRKAQAISKVCLAATARLGNQRRVEDVRIAFGSVAPVPLRCPATERALIGNPLTPAAIQAALGVLQSEIGPIDDIRSSAAYRRAVAKNLLAQFLEGL